MSRTRLHTELAKCRNGITDWDNASRNTLNHCYRRNFEVGKRRANKKSLIEKIIDRETEV